MVSFPSCSYFLQLPVLQIFSVLIQVLHQDETPLLYSLVFGEGVVNDATSVVLFNAVVQKIDITRFSSKNSFHVLVDFLYLFFTSTILRIVVSIYVMVVYELNQGMSTCTF